MTDVEAGICEQHQDDYPRRYAASMKAKVRVWRPTYVEGFELTSHDSTNVPFGTIAFTGYSLGVRLKGVRFTSYRRGSYITHPGTFLAYAPGDTMTARPVSGEIWSHREIAFSHHACETLLHDDCTPPADLPGPIITDAGANRRLYALFLSCYDSFARNDEALECQSKLVSLLIAVANHSFTVQRAAPVRREPSAVRRIKEYLHAHQGDNVTLEMLAALTGLSKYYLLRVFKNYVGVSPHTYMTQLRVDRAKELLIKGTPIAQVALEVGYADQSNFHYAFKKRTLVTPGQFQRDN